MMKCVNCNINIGGNVKNCPLCQNSLTGESSHDNWPSLERFKRQAFFYKLQLFIALTIVAIALSLDFLLDLNDSRHWSLIVALGIIMFEYLLKGFLKKNLVIAKIISVSALHIAIILVVTGIFFEFINLVIYTIIPIMVIVTLVADFVFTLIDTRSNAMVYFLMNFLCGICPYIFFFLTNRNRSITWTICLMISVVTFIGIVVFKGPRVRGEVQRRMNL